MLILYVGHGNEGKRHVRFRNLARAFFESLASSLFGEAACSFPDFRATLDCRLERATLAQGMPLA